MSHSLFYQHPANLKEIETPYYGYDLLLDPLLNKGTAFTEAEREEFHLHGLLPKSITRIEDQISRRIQVLNAFETNLEKYAFLRELQDNNETLFYSVLVHHLEALMPIIYTPTVGAGCQHFSRLFRKPRGLYLAYPLQDHIDQILSNPRFNQTEVIVVTDGERVLGLGDLGAGGMGIPIGKLSLYCACAGLHPATTLPILLDVGTNNEDCLSDPLYIGWRHERIIGQHYDEFVDTFINAVKKRFPNVLLQWEDFAKHNATRLLERYRDQFCTFNDDIQGTAAAALGTLLSAINVTQIPLSQQKIVILGAGSAGIGIAHLLVKMMISEGENSLQAHDKIFLVDREGLLIDKVNSQNSMTEVLNFQKPFLKNNALIEHWQLADLNQISLLDVIRNVKPNVLIGVSGQSKAFSKEIVQAMSNHVERPIIFPLSNPTSHAEASPEEIHVWSEGRAIISTGSPFPDLIRAGKPFKIDQTNNSYIFPGIGLASIALRPRIINDAMFLAAAKALSKVSPSAKNPNANLLPPVSDLREVSLQIALAVAEQAYKEGLSTIPNLSMDRVETLIRNKIWEPRYLPYKRIKPV